MKHVIECAWQAWMRWMLPSASATKARAGSIGNTAASWDSRRGGTCGHYIPPAVIKQGAGVTCGSAKAKRLKGVTSMRVFITGSSDGLGFLAGKLLLEQGHNVVLHARDTTKARTLRARLPACDAVVVGDVSTITAMKSVAEQVNALGRFDSIIHNVALEAYEDRVMTADGITQIFAVNVVAPYLLTALIEQPKRFVYLSSDMHASGDGSLNDLQWERRSWNGYQAYSDTKLHDLVLSMYVARRWPHVLANALNPGWIPTRLGGKNATGNFNDGVRTQVWLAVSEEASATVSGIYFDHHRPQACEPAACTLEVQERLIDYLGNLTQIWLP
jgi:NAD(P)-dependent dehydrogenase (short-subunit alcohol dehydrogenase family)